MATELDVRGGVRIAADIGGTFTDCVVMDASGRRVTVKASTTTQAPAGGVIDALHLAAARLDIGVHDLLEHTQAFVHGTTVGTNIVVERRGARTGLLMTQGHQETITIGRVRQKVAGLSEREKIHITHLQKATPPIVAPQDVRGVIERVDRNGAVVCPLDLRQASDAIDDLVDSGVEALAVCLLWSFVNPSHEERIRDLVLERYPDCYLSISSEVAPLLGEYERGVSTVFNSYIGPGVQGYLTHLESALSELGMACSLLVMQSSGGVSTVDVIRSRPIQTLDSGPAGGVLGARFDGAVAGIKNLICADAGGTTFDVGLVFGGEVQADPAPVITQYTYLMPKIYVRSIGAGGGSIAWLDPAGGLRVGPRSAGAVPGPVCYGRGGTEPTVTDAHLILGYLDPGTMLGDSIRLDYGAAERALTALAAGVGMDTVELAAGITAISNAQMADLVRKVTVERGLDPRDFALLAYGGAGPMFAAAVAQQVGAQRVYCPPGAGVFSAFGMLTTDLRLQEERTMVQRLPLAPETLQAANDLLDALDQRVVQRFEREGYRREEVVLARSVDMRFGMQVNELTVPVPEGSLSTGVMDEIAADFLRRYEFTYGAGSAYEEAGAETVTFRSVGLIHREPPTMVPSTDGRTGAEPEPKGEREAHFPESGGFVRTVVYSGERFFTGQSLSGPAIIEFDGYTVVVPPGTTATVDEYSNTIIRPDGSEPR